MNRASSALLLLPLLMLACGGDFDPSSRVNKLRLLAVRADVPIARAGETVTLDALAFDPASRPIAWGWATCTDPPSSSALGCLGAIDPDSFAVGQERRAVVVTGASLMGVVVVACPGTIERAPSHGVPITCRDGSGRALALEEYELGVKRILVRARDRNLNPALAAITWDGAPWAEDDVKEVDAGSEHRLGAQVSEPESGADERGVPFEEQTVVQYYATDGKLEHVARVASAAETKFTAPGAGTPATMWIVARDDRGGVSFAVRRMRSR